MRALSAVADTLPADEAALVAQMAQGSRAALATLYARHAACLYGLALSVLADAQEAQEALQETFLCAWQRAGTYRAERGPVRSWLLTLVRTRAIDRRRRHRARRRLEACAADAQGGCAPDEAGPERSAIASQEQVRVRAALQQLSCAERQALQLAYFQGLSQQEVAAVLGMPLGSVKTCTRRALLKLGACLAGSAPGR